jgi:hypothetical protein
MAPGEAVTAPAVALIDERTGPPLRQRVGRLLAGADDAAFAVARIRLAVLDLTDEELGRMRRCRVLLGFLDAAMLAEASEAAGPAGPGSSALARLHHFAASGRLQVRSAGLARWTPDFAVITGPDGPVGLVGSIQFGAPELVVGPAFTMVARDDDTVTLLRHRFDELWDRSHDVLPAIHGMLQRAS